MNKSDERERNIFLATTTPTAALKGETPRLIDEWQLVPILWDSVRHEADSRNKERQFILTASSVPKESNEIFHSGAGKISKIKMKTMSLFEGGDSDGQISLKELFLNKQITLLKNNLIFEQIAFLICRGGRPYSSGTNERVALGLIKTIIIQLYQLI